MSRNLRHLKSTERHFLRMYAAVLRCHRTLPGPMRELGDRFVRTEFEQHKPHATSPENLRRFFVEWTHYLKNIISQAQNVMDLQQGQQQSQSQSPIDEQPSPLDDKSENRQNTISLLKFGEHLDINQIQGMSIEQMERLGQFWEKADERTVENMDKDVQTSSSEGGDDGKSA